MIGQGIENLGHIYNITSSDHPYNDYQVRQQNPKQSSAPVAASKLQQRSNNLLQKYRQSKQVQNVVTSHVPKSTITTGKAFVSPSSNSVKMRTVGSSHRSNSKKSRSNSKSQIIEQATSKMSSKYEEFIDTLKTQLKVKSAENAVLKDQLN